MRPASPGVAGALVVSLFAAAGCLGGCGSGEADTTASAAGRQLAGWMKALQHELGDDGRARWTVSLDAGGDHGRGCASGEARRTYLATTDLPGSHDEDNVGSLLTGQLTPQGWAVQLDEPVDPDGKGVARLWSAVREGDDPTGTRLDISYQQTTPGTYHYVVTARTACLPTS